MFTGIVEAVGEVTGRAADEGGRRLRLAAPFAADLDAGDSVSVSGACLTVEDPGPEGLSVFLSAETVERTTLGALDVGDRVNLERALAASGRFDGHVVQGHVDGTTSITDVRRVGEDWVYAFSLPTDLARYVVEKGSITVDGVSLTVADLDDASFSVAVIPTTYAETTLADREPDDRVNLEVDVLAKYVERLLDRDGEGAA